MDRGWWPELRKLSKDWLGQQEQEMRCTERAGTVPQAALCASEKEGRPIAWFRLGDQGKTLLF